MRAGPASTVRRTEGPRAGEREESRRGDAHVGEEPAELVLDHVGERSGDKQGRSCARGLVRHLRDEGGKRCVLALGEGRLDAAAGIVEHPDARGEGAVEAAGGALQVELDDLGGAGAHEEEGADVGAALQQAGDDAVEFLVGVGEAGEVALLHDGGGEARLGEDHHAGRRLQQVGAGARADDEEEGVLHLAVQPDDAGEAAEDLALAALLDDGGVGAASRAGTGEGVGGGCHDVCSTRGAARSSRARRSFTMYWAALTT